MPLIEITDGTLYFEDAGAGDAVLCLLPQSSGPVGVGPLVESLARARRVIRYDQAGTGRSSARPNGRELSMQLLAAEALALLDALGIARVHLLCHSTGCGIGVALAAASPARVDSLVLISPWTHGDAYLRVAQNLRIDIARVLDPVAYARYNAALLFPPEYRDTHLRAFDEAAEACAQLPHDAQAIARRLHAILSFDARPLLVQVDCPALVVGASDDQLMPAWFAREAARLLPAARLVELDGGGHMLPETRGESLAAHLLSFWRQLD